MKKVFINKARMYRSTDLALDKFAYLFAGNDELNAAHLALKNAIKVIDEDQEVLVVDSTGLTDNKIILRTVFTLRTLKISIGLKAYATTLKDTAMFTKVDYQLNDLNRLPDPILFNTGSMLFKLANPMRDKLARFFLTDDDFSGMEKMINDFKTAFPQKRMATTVSKSTNTKMAEVFRSTGKLLKEVIDVLVAPYQFEHPDFFREYTNARIIVGYTGSRKSKPGKKQPPTEKE